MYDVGLFLAGEDTVESVTIWSKFSKLIKHYTHLRLKTRSIIYGK